MPGDQCIVCGNTRHKDKSVSLHRVPRKEPKRGRWLEAIDLVEEDLKDFHRVCSRHFLDGDATKDPQLNLGSNLLHLRSDGPRGPNGLRKGMSCSVNSIIGIFC